MIRQSFVDWLLQWSAQRRPLQKTIIAAVFARACEELDNEEKELLVRMMIGSLSEPLAEVLQSALGVVQSIEEDFFRKNGRMPSAAELSYGATCLAEEELKRELDSWDSPF